MWDGRQEKSEEMKKDFRLRNQTASVSFPTLPLINYANMVKNLPANAGDARNTGSMPGSGRSPREGNGNPLQYSCLRNPIDRGAWWATVHGLAKSRTRLSTTRAD